MHRFFTQPKIFLAILFFLLSACRSQEEDLGTAIKTFRQHFQERGHTVEDLVLSKGEKAVVDSVKQDFKAVGAAFGEKSSKNYVRETLIIDDIKIKLWAYDEAGSATKAYLRRSKREEKSKRRAEADNSRHLRTDYYSHGRYVMGIRYYKSEVRNGEVIPPRDLTHDGSTVLRLVESFQALPLN